METALGYIITFIIGGGLAELFRTFRESRKLKAEAHDLEVNTEITEDKAHTDALIVIIDNLRADNQTLREERNGYRMERDDYWDRLREAEKRIERLQAELNSIQKELLSFMQSRPPTPPPDEPPNAHASI